MNKPGEPRVHWRDLSEMAIGASIISFPLAVKGEILALGAELPIGRILVFAAVSIVLLSVVVYVIHRHDEFPLTRRAFGLRVISTYTIAVVISTLMLLGLDRIDLIEKPWTFFKTAILISFPASFAATAVDSFAHRPDD